MQLITPLPLGRQPRVAAFPMALRPYALDGAGPHPAPQAPRARVAPVYDPVTQTSAYPDGTPLAALATSPRPHKVVQPVNWKPFARDLANALKASQDLSSPHRCEAFAQTPRHRSVPASYRSLGGAPTVWRRLREDDGEERLRPVCTNATLVTHLDPVGRTRAKGGWAGVPVSSSTQPSRTARILEALGVEPGDEVLDAGLGTGYQAALLRHRLGDSRQLTTVDVDRDYVEEARRRLEGLGHRPTTVVGDATVRATGRSFRRVVVTFGPPKAAEFLRAAVAPGGRLIANVMSPLSYRLAVLDALPDGTLEGRFHPDGGAFMPARHLQPEPVRKQEADLEDLREGTADVPPRPAGRGVGGGRPPQG
ncbi:methyltransferase domain-containing protein [Streptomyces spectabilis]|uniref:methyltransferase domain-containing protein n=1 Tax=Streptomyces spectabilis TaxID=68270 RepID=UPI0013786BF2|nr:methyltransferase domain-containing protein [Streptomyces spectabilis]